MPGLPHPPDTAHPDDIPRKAVWLEFRVALWEPLGIGLHAEKGNVCAFKPGCSADNYNKAVPKDESWNQIVRGDRLVGLQQEDGCSVLFKGLTPAEIAQRVEECFKQQKDKKPIKLCFRGLREVPAEKKSSQRSSNSPLDLPELVTPRSQRPSPAKVSPSLAGPDKPNLSPTAAPTNRPSPGLTTNNDRPSPGLNNTDKHSPSLAGPSPQETNSTDDPSPLQKDRAEIFKPTPSVLKAISIGMTPASGPYSGSRPGLANKENNGTLNLLSPEGCSSRPMLLNITATPNVMSMTTPHVNKQLASLAPSSKKSSPQALALKDTLADPALRSAFHAHTRRQFCAENLEFLQAAQQFKQIKQENKASSEEIAACANNVFNDFLKEGSEKQVNLPSWILEGVQKDIARGNLTAELFQKPSKEIFNLLLRDVFSGFMPEYETLKNSSISPSISKKSPNPPPR
eukprot:gb/GEZN01003798.1/.p1 GENE.gb/GEZN01003798.1/~~gb/GEZN01003798.1/.p1  ORF type:complete len:456 (-),score=78.12 gb/GEZN01003798.1/:669-2036(-)